MSRNANGSQSKLLAIDPQAQALTTAAPCSFQQTPTTAAQALTPSPHALYNGENFGVDDSGPNFDSPRIPSTRNEIVRGTKTVTLEVTAHPPGTQTAPSNVYSRMMNHFENNPPMLDCEKGNVCSPTKNGDHESHDVDAGVYNQHPYQHCNQPSTRRAPSTLNRDFSPYREDPKMSPTEASPNDDAGRDDASPKPSPYGVHVVPRARPFTPPVVSLSQLLRKNPMSEEGECIEVMFDPVMDIYYDPSTNKYYELKDPADMGA